MTKIIIYNDVQFSGIGDFATKQALSCVWYFCILGLFEIWFFQICNQKNK